MSDHVHIAQLINAVGLYLKRRELASARDRLSDLNRQLHHWGFVDERNLVYLILHLVEEEAKAGYSLLGYSSYRLDEDLTPVLTILRHAMAHRCLQDYATEIPWTPYDGLREEDALPKED